MAKKDLVSEAKRFRPERRIKRWADRLGEKDQAKLTALRTAYLAGELEHLTVKDLHRFCIDKGLCPVKYMAFRDWLYEE